MGQDQHICSTQSLTSRCWRFGRRVCLRKGCGSEFQPRCYDPLRYSCRAQARYCGDDCAQTMRRVLDRERKWLCRNNYVGRFKRQLEYQRARHKRAHDAAPAPES